MAKYKVSLTKVFGLALTNTTTIEAESVDDARDKAKDAGSYTDISWDELYNSVTKDKFTDSYEIAEIIVDGQLVQNSMFSHELLNEAVELNKETYQQ